ncbi:hypothetical protein CONLIGDRAFT_673710 [Coniochaeta ligniaria NRRL 30616]|uniref:Uncharacterized protein n=1 Tax=Coniochaeta ligniaria NRRL 30616 TaxID=1408157 RepID=A0A1J7IB72_9PEZI|nr:hypothetical protein CONLIGDRAFT_673710 [Coniochaeta ligniaria NRRL 30616]
MAQHELHAHSTVRARAKYLEGLTTASSTTTTSLVSSTVVRSIPSSTTSMSTTARPPARITARLIAWEGGTGERVNEQRLIKEYTAHLKESITEAAEGTGWRYQRFKTYKTSSEGTFKLELHLVHPDAPDSNMASEQLLQLCDRLLSSKLATLLRSLSPGAGFIFAPSREGTLTHVDKKFMRCFSVSIVGRYCINSKLSTDMGAERDGFLTRNSTRMIHTIMLGMHDAATMVTRCEGQIEDLVQQLEKFNTVAFNRGIVRVGAAICTASDERAASLEATAQCIRVSIANACHLMRAVKGFAPDVKQALEQKLLALHGTVIQARLTLASDAYTRESVRGISALKLLTTMEKPTPDDLAITINSFGNLMQTTMPLFHATLAINDEEFKEILPNLAIAGVGAAAAVAASSLIYFGAATLLGPVGLMGAAAGAIGLAFGAKGAKKGAEWKEDQKSNPSAVLLDVQKTVEECAAYLLSLLIISTEEEGGDDAAFLRKVQALQSHVSSDLVFTPEYVKTYFKMVTKKLEKDMLVLKTRLEKYSGRLAARQLSESRPLLSDPGS